MIRKLRILIATDHYPPYIGGAHRQTQLLSHELKQRGHEVTVATVWHPGLPEIEDDHDVKVYRFRQLRTMAGIPNQKPYQRNQPPFPDPVTVVGLRRLIRKIKPDLVHSHGWYSYSCAAALLGMDIPLIISARDYGYHCATRTMLYEDVLCSGPGPLKCTQCATQFYRSPKGLFSVIGLAASRGLLMRKLRGIHTVSSFVLETFRRDFLRKDQQKMESGPRGLIESVIPSFLIQNGSNEIDNTILKDLPSGPFILFVGGLEPRKGLDTLLKAYSLLERPIPLVMVGYATPTMPKSFPEGIQVLLNIPHAGVMQAWKRCRFGVMPSVWPDPSPGVVREAFSQGKAVVGTRTGGTPEMIFEGENGLLVPPGDAPEMAKAIQRLIDDDSLRQKLGQRALEQAARYQAGVIVPQFEALYCKVLNMSEASDD